MAYNKILVTVDGSKLSEMALQHVLRIANPGAHVRILSVVADDPVSEVASLANALSYTAPIAPQWPPVNTQIDPREVDARQKYVNGLGEWLGQAGFDVICDTKTGGVVESILEVAKQGFDLIVMASHGRTGVTRMVLGSIAEAVLHQSPCPILIIPVRNAPAENQAQHKTHE